jgi:hypothetical protein
MPARAGGGRHGGAPSAAPADAQQEAWLVRYWADGGTRGAPASPRRQAAAAARAAPVEDDLGKFVRQLKLLDSVTAISITRQSTATWPGISSSRAMQERAAGKGAPGAPSPPLVVRPSKRAEAQLVAAVAHALRGGSLASLTLGIRLQEPASCSALGEALAACSSLRKLSFAGAGFGDAALEWLRPALHQCAGLQLLDLSGCGLGDAAAEALPALIRGQAGGGPEARALQAPPRAGLVARGEWRGR